MAHASTCDKLCCYLLYFFSACFTILPHGLMRSSVIFMGGCIEMKGIHHILHTLDRALCHDINILVPICGQPIRMILSGSYFLISVMMVLAYTFKSALVSSSAAD